jgi:hypothetical protein
LSPSGLDSCLPEICPQTNIGFLEFWEQELQVSYSFKNFKKKEKEKKSLALLSIYYHSFSLD